MKTILSIMEPFIAGTEPYNKNDIMYFRLSLGIINNSISGTGSLLIE